MPAADRQRILLFGYRPPPVFGPSVAYQTLLDSSFVERHAVTFINLSVVRSIRELEALRLGKVLKLGGFVLRELFFLATRRFDYGCYPLSFNRNAFLKDLLLLRLASWFGVPVVLFAHGTGLAPFRDSLAAPWRRRFDATVRSAAGVIVIAEALRQEFSGLLPPARIFVVPLGIQPVAPPPTRATAPDRFTLLYLGALVRAKGIFDLLNALPLVRDHCPTARLVVAGEWFRAEEEAEAHALLARHQVADMVEFVGPVQGPAKWTLLHQANLLVFPCHTAKEAFGIVLLEAMQAGLPIVTTRGGARSELIVDGVHGLLAEEQNPADLAAKIVCLADEPALRQSIGKANREQFARLYTAECYAARMTAVFEMLQSQATVEA